MDRNLDGETRPFGSGFSVTQIGETDESFVRARPIDPHRRKPRKPKKYLDIRCFFGPFHHQLLLWIRQWKPLQFPRESRSRGHQAVTGARRFGNCGIVAVSGPGSTICATS